MDEKNKSSKKGAGCFAALIPVLIAIIVIISAYTDLFNTNNNNSSTTNNQTNNQNYNEPIIPKLLSRKATNNDIYYNASEDISFSMNLTIKPNVDIKNLIITIHFADSNECTLANKTRNLGNVNKNIDYKVSISIAEFSLSEIIKIERYYISVDSGTVSYFA